VTAPIRVRSAPFGTNTWIVPGRGGGCLVVDPGLDGEAVMKALQEARLRPGAVLCTHGHFDHVGSAAALQARFGAPVHLHRSEARTLRSGNFLMLALRLETRITLPEPAWVEDGEVVRAAGLDARFEHTPGHTPGSCVVRVGDTLFTGDTLYADGVGLVSLPGEDVGVLRASLRRLLEAPPGRVHVHPGHGADAPLARILEENGALRAFLAEGTGAEGSA
jgi:glyoxylase-like metal-dependent hydrolase (beta-lactamase superfamily II)